MSVFKYNNVIIIGIPYFNKKSYYTKEEEVHSLWFSIR